MVTTTGVLDEVRGAVAAVPDPEIPVVTIEDLGILRGVTIEDETIVVTITPTYTGCPAMGQIERDVCEAARRFGHVRVDTVYHPPWTTDWITDRGRQALLAYGIAPPPAVGTTQPTHCPRCSAGSIRVVSQFGSTACKALMACESCREPFDLFKAL